MTAVNARLGYKFENGVRIQLDALNLFNSKDHQIDYFYVSRLPLASQLSLAGGSENFDIAILCDCGPAATVFRHGYGKLDRRITVEPIPSSRVRE